MASSRGEPQDLRPIGYDQQEFAPLVAASGSTVVVGAADEGGIGGAYIYQERVGKWDQTAELTGSGLGMSSNFGGSVATFDRTIVVGAPLQLTATVGFVYIFADTTSGWQRTALIKG